MLFWVCLAAIVIAVAVAAREPLRSAFSQLGTKPDAPSPSAREAPTVTVAPLTERPRPPAPGPTDQTGPTTTARPVSPASSTPPEALPEHPAVRRARLYFTTIDPSGKILLKSVIRTIPASDSPLRDTLETLLKGPSAQELNLGLISMIPVGAQLRSVVVKGDTAIIDFSESFRFNAQGMQAMEAQLRQVVYAATEFPTVRKVQITIDGARVRYLGPEGIRLDVPLTRDSFHN